MKHFLRNFCVIIDKTVYVLEYISKTEFLQ